MITVLCVKDTERKRRRC